MADLIMINLLIICIRAIHRFLTPDNRMYVAVNTQWTKCPEKFGIK